MKKTINLLILLIFVYIFSFDCFAENDYVKFENNMMLQSWKYNFITIVTKVNVKYPKSSCNIISCGDENRGLSINSGKWVINRGVKSSLNPFNFSTFQHKKSVEIGEHYVTAIYSNGDEQLRLIVDDTVSGTDTNFASKSSDFRNKTFTVNTDPFFIEVKDVKIYDRILPIEELEKVTDKKIKYGREDYKIADRHLYKVNYDEKFRKMALEYVEKGKRYITFNFVNFELNSYTTPDCYGDVMKVFQEDEAFTVLDKVKNRDGVDYAKIISEDGKIGYIEVLNIFHDTYSEKEGSPIKILVRDYEDKLLTYMLGVFILKKWPIVLAISSFIIFLIFMKFINKFTVTLQSINTFIFKIFGVDYSYYSSPSSRVIYTFPVIFAGIAFFFGVLNSDEFDWYLKAGIGIFPNDFIYRVDWIFYVCFLLILASFVIIIIESIVIAGPFGFIPRLIYIGIICLASFFVMLPIVLYLALRKMFGDIFSIE